MTSNKITKQTKASAQPANKDIRIFSTLQLSQRAQTGDRLAQKLLERSASLIACQIAAISFFKKLKIKNLKLKIIMEDSLFWDAFGYQQSVKKYLKLLEIEDEAVSFTKIPASDILGASQLVINKIK